MGGFEGVVLHCGDGPLIIQRIGKPQEVLERGMMCPDFESARHHVGCCMELLLGAASPLYLQGERAWIQVVMVGSG